MNTTLRPILISLSAICSIFTLGCRGVPEEAPYTLTLTNELAPAAVKILLDGTELVSSTDRFVGHEFTGRTFSAPNPSGPGNFSVLVAAPWGWEEVASSVSPPLPRYHEVQAKAGRSTTLKIEFSIDDYPVGRFYLDNRDHEAVEVGIGQAAYDFPANTATETRFGEEKGLVFLLPRDGSDAEVTLNGLRVGEIDLSGGPVETAYEPVYVLDTSGSRQYRLQHLQYGGITAYSPPRPSIFRGAHLHRLATHPPNRFYFLAEAPETVRVPIGESILALELTEVVSAR